MKQGKLLLLIDPQYDFHDVPMNDRVRTKIDGVESLVAPALPVPGSYDDATRLSYFLERCGTAISDIVVTVDAHSVYDIAHPLYWRDRSGNHPSPFTTISHSDVLNGDWVPSIPSLLQECLDYTSALEKSCKDTLMIWPPHCITGGIGQTIVEPIMSALNSWSANNLRVFTVVAKGQNPHTEHYGGLCAEVELPGAPETGVNRSLMSTISMYETVYIAGQALSHCVGATIRQILEYGETGIGNRLCVLIDCTSAVTGFESKALTMVEEFKQHGVRFLDSSLIEA